MGAVVVMMVMAVLADGDDLLVVVVLGLSGFGSEAHLDCSCRSDGGVSPISVYMGCGREAGRRAREGSVFAAQASLDLVYADLVRGNPSRGRA